MAYPGAAPGGRRFGSSAQTSYNGQMGRRRWGSTRAMKSAGGSIRVAPWFIGVVATCGLFGSAGCVGLVPAGEGTVSFGHTSSGMLREGRALAQRGSGYVRARPGDGTRFGTPTTVGALERAAASVTSVFPGGAPLRVGDLSAPGGGRHSRHRSHRTGRDVDVIFYAVDEMGRSAQGRGWLAYDRFGLARDPRSPPHREVVFHFDDARNWHLVRTLVADPRANVQWIFCSRGLKARLLEYARVHEPDPEILVRASWVLHQPSRGRAHDDHFHIRFACTAEEQAAGCVEYGPIWPWMRNDVEKPATGVAESDALTDEGLLAALFTDPPEPQELTADARP